MSCSLSSLATNLSEGLHNDRCTDCKSYLDSMVTKDVLNVKRIMRKTLNKKLIKRFANIYDFAMETSIDLFCY